MQADSTTEQRVIDKIRGLFPEQILQVEEFIDSLYKKNTTNTDSEIAFVAAKLSEPAFEKIWDNPDDAEYDKL
ncbi:hypothetical protein DSM106972_030350 [Dulcicalothrix desertica PCC 7102]|uniref:Toxin-antitoxin system, antitoxin component, Xre family protein n=1 Tax=Dulcicalothrix desertica PCC 7102 TaxID=232991 RepID=A0A433VKX0_9CYAN|nr:toxin-antitoxin system, antitoxin component, Xre family protein [Dulcicalothrix desertica]RUT06778.1 hypothetical protein DSM106972_030350 [Dulcicalothrix desertica PCC 7102]TWH50113.1 hypothetical protein CAL7102_04397 [Dulcicalothrix desertica PCC 7102]